MRLRDRLEPCDSLRSRCAGLGGEGAPGISTDSCGRELLFKSSATSAASSSGSRSSLSFAGSGSAASAAPSSARSTTLGSFAFWWRRGSARSPAHVSASVPNTSANGSPLTLPLPYLTVASSGSSSSSSESASCAYPSSASGRSNRPFLARRCAGVLASACRRPTKRSSRAGFLSVSSSSSPDSSPALDPALFLTPSRLSARFACCARRVFFHRPYHVAFRLSMSNSTFARMGMNAPEPRPGREMLSASDTDVTESGESRPERDEMAE